MVQPKLALALCSVLSAAIGAQAAAPAWPNPPLAYLSEYSFRGLNDKAVVDNYEVSGHSAVLPGVHDFLRLVPATPLAHGSAFTSKPLQSDEWVAEIAFRVHGPATVGVTEHAADGSVKRNHKGGRGLAFWYTKTANPTPITLSPNPKAKLTPPPLTVPREPTDPSDGAVSLFGNRPFGLDGLGVVFDTSPGSPVFARSDRRNWAVDQAHGVGTTGVVSGIMDDGSGSWLEPKGRVMRADDEADYLGKAIGECEAAFRNAQGLLWARISHVNNSIRVDLDLAPHTTLSKAGRDYAHNCFHLDGITLPKGSYLGVSGLASGNTEPDAVDIYALDVFEVVKPGSTPAGSSEPPVEAKHTGPLEGTSDDAVGSLAQEIFLSQAKMMEAIDSLTVRVESLARLVDAGALGGGAGQAPKAGGTDPHLDHKLGIIETRLGELTAASRAHREAVAAAAAVPAAKDDSESFKHLVQLQDRLMVELKSFGRKLDNSNGQSASTLATLSSRTAEAAQLLQRLSTAADEAAAKTWAGSWQSIAGLVVLVLGVIVWRRRRDDNPWGTGKKMI